MNQNSDLPTFSISLENPYNGDDAQETRNRPGEAVSDTLAEISAHGFRSPFQINFDTATGALYLGDVGAGSREEVDLVLEAENYGWNNREGTLGNHPPGGSVNPLFEYNHGEGKTVIGGFVYRGTELFELVGKYIFAEFGEDIASSRLFYGIIDENDPDGDVGEFFDFQIDPNGPMFPIDTNGDFEPDAFGDLPDRIFSIGEDKNGKLLLVVAIRRH